MAIYDVSGGLVNSNSIVSDLRSEAFTVLIAEVQGNQGACTDGEYLYSANTNSTVFRFDILGRTTTSETVSVNLDHANDMTYNPITDKLYVATMDTDGHIAVIDPDTFESELFVLEVNGSPQQVYGLAYDRVHNQYITANNATNGTGYSFFDSEFNYIKTITISRNESYTIQGIETDGVYIYRALYDVTTQRNYVYVHDMDMNYITHIEIPISGELESIAYDWDGSWYVIYGARKAYYVGMSNAMSFETAKQFQKIVTAYSV